MGDTPILGEKKLKMITPTTWLVWCVCSSQETKELSNDNKGYLNTQDFIDLAVKLVVITFWCY